MGNSFANVPVIGRCFHLKKTTIMMEGLDAAGKTTLLYRMKNPKDEIVTTIPTIGFNLETLKFGNIQFLAYDVGGRNRSLSKMASQNIMMHCEAVGFCFVIDSADDRFDEAKEHLLTYFERHQQYTEFQHNIKAILILANKQDLPNAMKPEEMADKLDVKELERLTECPVCVMGCSAYTNTGLQEAIEWITYSTTNNQSIKKSIKKSIEKAFSEDSNKVTDISKLPTAPKGVKSYFEYIKQLLMY